MATLVGIGGSRSKVGKTSMAEALLRCLGPGWAAIKCEPKYLYSSIVDDPETLQEPGTDTARMLNAGAEEVLWVQASDVEPEEALHIAISRLANARGILIEGNRAIEVLKPDTVIFIYSSEEPKPSGKRVLPMSTLLVGDGPAPEGAPPGAMRFPWGRWAEAAEHLKGLINADKG